MEESFKTSERKRLLKSWHKTQKLWTADRIDCIKRKQLLPDLSCCNQSQKAQWGVHFVLRAVIYKELLGVKKKKTNNTESEKENVRESAHIESESSKPIRKCPWLCLGPHLTD